MMNELGRAALVVALAVSAFGALAAEQGALGRRPGWLRAAERAGTALALLLTLASGALLYALVARDFRVVYVASNTSRDLPLLYTVSAFWAGQAGSLLLWAWLLALFAPLVVHQNRSENRALLPHALAVLYAIAFFFLVLLVFLSDPFELSEQAPPEGRGLNPLLQNPGMFFHPPTTLLGYAGFAVPFAFAMAALLTGHLGSEWIRTTRRWTLFAWFFLMLGNLFGGQWAYQVLGWGGYWAWDPVENSSFMPWLTGTAYLHSVMVQERRNMLKVWNIALIILTFDLTIFGTFITRSGVITSVHSFAQSALGPLFLVFMAVALLGPATLLYRRLDALRSENELDAVVSRESSFLFNNLLLVGAAFATFWGTVFPMVTDALRGVKVSVGPPFFNQVNIPIGLALLLLMGACPLLAWRRASPGNLLRNFTHPAALGVLVAGALYALGVRYLLALAAFAVSAFVLAGIGQEVVRGVRARRRAAGETVGEALSNLLRRNRRRYGGYIIHVGVVLMYVGIGGSSAYQVERLVTLRPGQEAQVGRYTLRYEGLSHVRRGSAWEARANLALSNGGRPLGFLQPLQRFHDRPERDGPGEPHTVVAIRSTLWEDVYAIFNGAEQDGRAGFKLLVNPLVAWIWWGGAIMSLGALVVLWPEPPRPARSPSPSASPERAHAQV